MFEASYFGYYGGVAAMLLTLPSSGISKWLAEDCWVRLPPTTLLASPSCEDLLWVFLVKMLPQLQNKGWWYISPWWGFSFPSGPSSIPR